MNTHNINKTQKKTISLRLEQELYNRIKNMAKTQNRSVNNLIETLLMDYADDIAMTKNEYTKKLYASMSSGMVELSEAEQKSLFEI